MGRSSSGRNRFRAGAKLTDPSKDRARCEADAATSCYAKLPAMPCTAKFRGDRAGVRR